MNGLRLAAAPRCIRAAMQNHTTLLGEDLGNICFFETGGVFDCSKCFRDGSSPTSSIPADPYIVYSMPHLVKLISLTTLEPCHVPNCEGTATGMIDNPSSPTTLSHPWRYQTDGGCHMGGAKCRNAPP